MSDEVLRIMCPKLTCRRILAVPAEARGRTVRCKGCATVIRVPNKVEKPDPVEGLENAGGAPGAPGAPATPGPGGKPGEKAPDKPAKAA